jgi:hypothetical protein
MYARNVLTMLPISEEETLTAAMEALISLFSVTSFVEQEKE